MLSKKYTLLFLLALLNLSVVSAIAQTSKTDIFGYYKIVKPTADFTDISEISLGGNYGASEKPPFYGLIRLKKKGAKDFQLLKPTLDGKHLTFTTKITGGVSYQFDGNFTKLGNFPDTRPEGEVILKGKLTKFKDKTKVAEAAVSFSYTAGD